MLNTAPIRHTYQRLTTRSETSHLSGWPESRRRKTSVGEDEEKKEPSCTLLGTQTGAATGDRSEAAYEVKVGTPEPFPDRTTVYLPQKHKSTNLKRYPHPSVDGGVPYDSQDVHTHGWPTGGQHAAHGRTRGRAHTCSSTFTWPQRASEPTTWDKMVNRKGVLPSEISQRKTMWVHLYVESKEQTK